MECEAANAFGQAPPKLIIGVKLPKPRGQALPPSKKGMKTSKLRGQALLMSHPHATLSIKPTRANNPFPPITPLVCQQL